jgi:hypothetical protein
MRRTAFRIGVIAMAALAAAKLSDEFLRLVWRSGYTAAIDLKLRHAEVHAWFAGAPVYETMRSPTYPPATYVLLWPFLGWLPLEPARWLWAATTAAALAWLTWLVVRESGATAGWDRAFAALMVLALNQTGVAVGNGQLILLVLPPLLAGLFLIHRGRGRWLEDVVAAACIIFTLVKITLTAPFLWLVLFAPVPDDPDGARRWRWRPAALVAVGYAILTAWAMTFQPGPWPTQLRSWLERARVVAAAGGDYANVHTWLSDAGLERLMTPASAVLFVALGLWLYRYRRVDLWLRLGVVALVARFWAYHRLYDDVLVVLALVPLFHLATSAHAKSPVGARAGEADPHAPSDQRFTSALLGVTMLVMLLPARLGTAAPPWQLLFNGSHALAWLCILGVLVRQAQRA